MQETSVESLGQEDPLEKKMATHFSIVPWESPWEGEPCEVQSMRLQRVRYDLVTKKHLQFNSHLTKNSEFHLVKA